MALCGHVVRFTSAPFMRRRHEKVQYIDCGAAFLINDPARPGGRVIDARLMPDGVHPSAVGMDVLGLCLDPTVAYLKSHPHAGERKKFADEVCQTSC